MALEEAGELQEAARVFEYAGQHAQAALLRIEHAKTLRDAGERLDVLREGCARNPGTTPEGRRLHTTLADALLEAAEHTPDSAERRALELEAARALEEADDHTRAGELYESLNLLHKAAAAYESGGAIERLELVLEVLERAERHASAQRTFEREVDTAIADGRRRYAHTQLLDLTGRSAAPAALGDDTALTTTPVAALGYVPRLRNLESQLLRRPRLDLRWGAGNITSIHGVSRFRIGRAPDADLTVAGPLLSRYHVELGLDLTEERPCLYAMDLGSKVGTFWQGEPLLAGDPTPIRELGELALGMAASLELARVDDRDGVPVGAFLRLVGSDRWVLFLPGGGPLWLTPELRVPARVLFDRGYVVLDFASQIAATLHGRALPRGAAIELMVGDRIALVAAPLTMEVLT